MAGQIEVDTSVCMGSGMCEFLAPEHFRLTEAGVAEVIATEAISEETAARVISQCPTGAITRN
jgi:ferredoxin